MQELKLEDEKFLKTQNEIATPYYDSLVQEFMENCKYAPPPDTPLKKALPENLARMELEKELRKAAMNEGEKKRALKGMDLINKEIQNFPGGDLYHKELMQAEKNIYLHFIEPTLDLLAAYEEEKSAPMIFEPTQKQEKEEKGNATFWQNFVPLAKIFGISFDTLSIIYKIGNNFFNSGHFEDAAAVYEVLSNFDGSLENAWFGAGLAHFRLKNWHEAVANFTMAATVNPTNPINFADLAYCYLELGDIIEAKKMIEIIENLIGVIYSNEKEQKPFKLILSDLQNKLTNFS